MQNGDRMAQQARAIGATCVIPARYESTRLPGKPLIDFGGKPMIVRTYERACRFFTPDRVIVATDDNRIAAACRAHGVQQVELTDPNCRTGTDRVAEVAARHPEVNVWVNVQGDEPLLPDGVIIPVLNSLCADVAATNGRAVITNSEHVTSNTIPKVVSTTTGTALYLSRCPIPTNGKHYRQVCVYAFWKRTLARFAAMETGPLEEAESIEILRLIEHGLKVQMVDVPGEGLSVDVPADVAAVKQSGGWT